MTKLNNALRSRNWIQKDIQPPKDSIDFPDRTLDNRTDRGPFTEEEFEKVLELVEERSPISGEIMIFAYETGARYEGAIRLTADQVRTGDPKVPAEKGRFFVDRVEKGGKKTTVEISASYYKYLQEKISENNKDNPDLPAKEKYVFPHMSDSNINKQIKKACQELEITDRKLHGVRGLSGVMKYMDSIEKGMDKTDARDEASEYLGHSSGRSISNYTGRT
jgi:integrase